MLCVTRPMGSNRHKTERHCAPHDGSLATICGNSRGQRYGIENPKITLESHKIIEISFDGENYGLWLYGYRYGDELYVYTKDYGKTWALTREELEE